MEVVKVFECSLGLVQSYINGDEKVKQAGKVLL